MQGLEERSVACPYCGERITVLVEPADQGSAYIEDCQVCCRPILFQLGTDSSGALELELRREDD